MGKPRFKFSWYLYSDQPHQIAIGPTGYAEGSWHELGPVLTPEAWWGNGFYMDAECRCMLNREGLEMVFNVADRGVGKIYYSDINFQVPGIEHKADPDFITPEYIKWFDEKKLEYKRRKR